MDITITGRQTTITDALRSYVNEKIGTATKVFDINPMTCEVVLRVEKNPSNPDSNTCEVTLRARGHIIRVSESSSDMYAAIDAAASRTERRLRKFKTRVVDGAQKRHNPMKVDRGPMTKEEMDALLYEGDISVIEELEEQDLLVREKYIDYMSLTTEEALVQTDLIGHDFFVYNDKDTGNTHVVYRRDNGGYGILKPADEYNM